MTTTERLHLRVLSGTVTVESARTDLLDSLADLFAYFPRQAGATLARFSIEGDEEDLRLIRDGQPILVTNCAGYLLAQLEYEIFAAAVQRENEHLVLHAAAVGLEGLGILLAGGKGAGKTTLAASLIGEGFSYYGDEMVVVDGRTRRLLPLPRTMNLKAPTVSLLGVSPPGLRVGTYDDDPSRYPARFGLPTDDRVGHAPLEIGLLLLPRRIEGPARLAEVRGSEAAVHLVRHAYNFFQMPERGFALVAELAGRTPAYVLEHGSLRRASSIIREVAGG